MAKIKQREKKERGKKIRMRTINALKRLFVLRM